jgi:predicted AlkP superfamily phosphohydrolase/phosphomutase
MARHLHELDWDHTVAYAATPSSQGVNLVASLAGPRRRALRAELAERLRAVRNPHTGEPLVLDVVTREQAFPGPHGAVAPDLSMVLAGGAAVSILRSTTTVRRRDQARGNHRFEGTFIAAGPGIRAGTHLDELAIVDVAPIVLHALGVPIPAGLDGRLPEELFEPGALDRTPPTYLLADPPEPVPAGVAAPLDPDEEAVVLDRLRALGYVD